MPPKKKTAHQSRNYDSDEAPSSPPRFGGYVEEHVTYHSRPNASVDSTVSTYHLPASPVKKKARIFLPSDEDVATQSFADEHSDALGVDAPSETLSSKLLQMEPRPDDTIWTSEAPPEAGTRRTTQAVSYLV